MADRPRDDDAEHDVHTPDVVPGLPALGGDLLGGDLLGGDLLGGDLLGGDIGGLLAQAQEMLAAQAAAAAQEVEGVAGGGVVRIRATGTGQVLSVHLAPEVVDPSDVPMLEDLVLAALHDVNARLADIQRAAMGPLGGLLGLDASDDSSDDSSDDDE